MTGNLITHDWLPRREIVVPTDRPPALLIVIDTEEEFDWNAPFDREQTSVRAMAASTKAQEIFDQYGLVATWVIDYPVASQSEGFGPLREFADSDRAVIGAHLHPWVSPPHHEEVSSRNSYPGNLPRELEGEKLRALSQRIEASFGLKPNIYKAGRYGLGPNTAEILEEQGFEVDLSACPPFDHGGDGGPDYTSFGAKPFWFGASQRLLGLPTTGEYAGFLARPWADRCYRFATSPRMRPFRMPGILSRLRAVERIRLSPEGYEFEDLKRLTRHLIRHGIRILTFSFHSPSLEPGHTDFVRSASDLQRFLDSFRRYFDFFLGELQGVGATPLELKRQLLELEASKDGADA